MPWALRWKFVHVPAGFAEVAAPFVPVAAQHPGGVRWARRPGTLQRPVAELVALAGLSAVVCDLIRPLLSPVLAGTLLSGLARELLHVTCR